MFEPLFEMENRSSAPKTKEGELYRVITTFGKTFTLRYG